MCISSSQYDQHEQYELEPPRRIENLRERRGSRVRNDRRSRTRRRRRGRGAQEQQPRGLYSHHWQLGHTSESLSGSPEHGSRHSETSSQRTAYILFGNEVFALLSDEQGRDVYARLSEEQRSEDSWLSDAITLQQAELAEDDRGLVAAGLIQGPQPATQTASFSPH